MEYKKQLYKFDIAKINNLSLYTFLIAFLIGMIINFLLKKPLLLTTKVYFDIILIIGIFVVGLTLHECIHAISAVIFGKVSFKEIKFGINLRQGMLYCHVNTPIKAQAYKVMLLLPAIITGLIPLIISMFLGNIFLVLVFSMLLCGGAGDFIMFMGISKLKGDTLVLDHAKAPAFYAVYESDRLPEDFSEVTEEQEKELIEEMKQSPFTTKDGQKKNGMLKTFAILVFLALAVLVVFIVGILMSYL